MVLPSRLTATPSGECPTAIVAVTVLRLLLGCDPVDYDPGHFSNRKNRSLSVYSRQLHPLTAQCLLTHLTRPNYDRLNLRPSTAHTNYSCGLASFWVCRCYAGSSGHPETFRWPSGRGRRKFCRRAEHHYGPDWAERGREDHSLQHHLWPAAT